MNPSRLICDMPASQVRRLAAELFVLGFPLSLMDAIRRAHPFASNRIFALSGDVSALAPGFAGDDGLVVRTSAQIDVAAGPVVLHMPDPHGRFFTVSLVDSAGQTFATFGPRTRHESGLDLVVAGPTWRGELTDGATGRRAPCDQVWAISRTLARAAADLPAVEDLVRRQRLTVLADRSDEAPPSAQARVDPPAKDSVREVVDMPAAVFLHRLGQLATRAPPDLRRRILLALEAWPGGSRGLPDDARDLQKAVEDGFRDGLANIRGAAARQEDDRGAGWRGASLGAGGAPVVKAAAALRQLGAPHPADVCRLWCQVDESGRRLSGDERYRMVFKPNSLPPVETSWLVRSGSTGPHACLSDVSDLVFLKDGSLEIALQQDPPPQGRPVNWLATPPGDFALQAHLYWPRPEVLSGEWRMPWVERLGSGYARSRREARAGPA